MTTIHATVRNAYFGKPHLSPLLFVQKINKGIFCGVKRLIASKIKVFFYIIFVCILCIVHINTHTYRIYFENISMYIFICI